MLSVRPSRFQPGTLRRLLTDKYFENGLAARLLPANPLKRQKQWTERDVAPDTEDDVDFVFRKLHELDFGTDGEPVCLGLSSEAKQRFVEFFDDGNSRVVAKDGAEAALWSKLEAYVPRLALIFHLVDAVHFGRDTTKPIDVAWIESAISIVDWFATETERVYRCLRETNEDASNRKLIEFIERKGGAVTPRDVLATHTGFSVLSSFVRLD